MGNPFEDQDEYLVLINAEEQYSLWPAFADVPGGWRVAHEKASRKICLDYIDANWVDMRPKSLKDRDNRKIS